MKIVLVCSAGMSTSLLVKKMNDAAIKKGLKVEIEAFAEADLKRNLENVDAILIGPQVRYLLSKIKQIAEPRGIAVDVIESRLYGKVDGEGVLNKALDMLKK
ncbi:phosphotransferase system lactose/cellobiose-specific IIB subunit [Thermoanaerobacterium thermosaccharolyticum DSM 571]|uniref:Phosphotransferase system lactose/cellobiose-specific IIB subunit n=1 Tax=Thermoanaerobacterium thermosaccharolyticum (strain ATCC 7956 / DSM 571 / NCIMB 9385 / NCA 3814 / NCTC 13789 / WDCM 00135 / 2032) TaxID=580327 RepID=D9TSA1_THETC|nr:PTS sugar transporter subunit IIB [Thermoanaerobacterium thermosaccharolyticum]ADL69824.1 phosphotransferase system lactose/cellobiose-specific IIB subunit [Thermoanaerobacterium thermosaccharolyticum DSM 571]